MSIEAVAERAGVAKTTIYRRWPSKEELVTASIGTLHGEARVSERGTTRDAVIAHVRQMRRFMVSDIAGRILPRMLGELADGTPLGRTYMQQVVRPRRALLVDLLRRGVTSGELRHGLDVELLADSIIGTMMLMRLTSERFAREDVPERVIDQLLEGAARGP